MPCTMGYYTNGILSWATLNTHIRTILEMFYSHIGPTGIRIRDLFIQQP